MAPPPRLRILSGEFNFNLDIYIWDLTGENDGSSSNQSMCSWWQCDLCLSLMATSGDNLLRRYASLEIRI